MPTFIRYRNPSRSKSRRQGRDVPPLERPEILHTPEEFDAICASFAARLDEVAEELKSTGMYERILALEPEVIEMDRRETQRRR